MYFLKGENKFTFDLWICKSRAYDLAQWLVVSVWMFESFDLTGWRLNIVISIFYIASRAHFFKLNKLLLVEKRFILLFWLKTTTTLWLLQHNLFTYVLVIYFIMLYYQSEIIYLCCLNCCDGRNYLHIITTQLFYN